MAEQHPYEGNLHPREKILNGISHIVFDLDDSLYHTQFLEDFSDSLRKHAVKMNVAKYIAEREGLTHKDAFDLLSQQKSLRKYMKDTYDMPMNDYFPMAWDIDAKSIITQPSIAPQVIHQLKEEDKKLLLVTLAPAIWQQRVFAHLGISEADFEAIYTGDQFDTKDVAFREITKGRDPTSILSIGDTPETDIAPAHALGIKTFQIHGPDDLRVLMK